MGGPNEAFRDFRVAFIVDLETAMVHHPGPGPLDHPTSREDHELVRMDTFDDLGRDVPMLAVPGERTLKPASQNTFVNLALFGRTLSTTAIPPALSDIDATTTQTAINRPRVSTIPNVFRPEIFFPPS